jgi:hypothetical protein
MQDYLPILSITISIAAFIIVLLKYKKDSVFLNFSYEIMKNGDSDENLFVRIHLFNTGHRPIYIKSVGYCEWSTGSYMLRGNMEVNQILNEAESTFVDEEFGVSLKSLADVKTFFAIDHKGKRWEIPQKEMYGFYEMSHYTGEPHAHVLKKINCKDEEKSKSKIEYHKMISKFNYIDRVFSER